METKKMILSVQLAFLACTVSCASPARRAPLPKSPEAKVWVCTGGSSKRYHAHSDCRGLRNCGGELLEVSLRKAQQNGRTPCRICFRKSSGR